MLHKKDAGRTKSSAEKWDKYSVKRGHKDGSFLGWLLLTNYTLLVEISQPVSPILQNKTGSRGKTQAAGREMLDQKATCLNKATQHRIMASGT